MESNSWMCGLIESRKGSRLQTADVLQLLGASHLIKTHKSATLWLHTDTAPEKELLDSN